MIVLFCNKEAADSQKSQLRSGGEGGGGGVVSKIVSHILSDRNHGYPHTCTSVFHHYKGTCFFRPHLCISHFAHHNFDPRASSLKNMVNFIYV